MRERTNAFAGLVNYLELSKRIGLLVLGAMLILAGTLHLCGGTLIYLGCYSFPDVPGKIVEFNIKPDPAIRSYRRIELKYEFTIDGEIHQGSRLAALGVEENQVHNWSAWYKSLKYEEGQPVRVTYDPKRPEISFIERPSLVGFGSGVVWCVLGLWMVSLFFRFRRRRVPARVVESMHRRIAKGPGEVFPDLAAMLRGYSSFHTNASLFSGLPKCRAGLALDRNHLAVVFGGYTRTGIASAVLTFVLLLFFGSSFLILYILTEVVAMLVRRYRWNTMVTTQFSELNNADPIGNVTIYGFDVETNRFWYRIDRRNRDEFIQLDATDYGVANYFARLFDLYTEEASLNSQP